MQNVEDAYPLSYTQSGMLYHCISSSDPGVYVTQVHSRITGSVNSEKLRDAWQAIVDRHPVLRTAFLWDGLEEPLQIVRTKLKVPFETVDWSHVAPDDLEEHLRGFLHSDRSRGFSLSRAPLVRIHLIHLSEKDHLLVWTIHHIICDGWSSTQLLHEVQQTYAENITGTPVGAYRAYIDWLLQRDQSADLHYWRSTFGNFSQPLTVPKSATTHAGVDQTELTLDEDLTRRLRELGKASRVSLSTVFHAAWAILLGRYCNTDDVVFGSTLSGRPAELSSIETMIGLFICTLPVRIKVDDSQSIEEFLQRAQSTLLDIQDHQFVPLTEIQRTSNLPPGQQLFSTMIAVENTPRVDHEQCKSLPLSEIVYRDQSNYPLALLVVPEDRIRLLLVFDCNKYTSVFIERMLEHLREILACFVGPGERSVGTVRMLSQKDVDQLDRWNDTSVAMPFQSVLDVLSKNLESWNGVTATIEPGRTMTYGELYHRSGEIASRLSAIGVRAGDRVGLLLPRSGEAIASMIAAMRLGAVYVPLDPEYPASRISFIANDAQCAAIVVSGTTTIGGIGIEERAVLDLEEQADTDVVEAIDDRRLSANDLVYVMYTSGSSGTPKGVAITHDNLYSSTMARLHRYDDAPGRFLLLPSLSFDSSVAGIYWSLCSGGAIVIPGPRAEQDMVGLSSIIKKEEVTHILCLPSLYRLLLDFSAASALSSLKVAIVAGEACSHSVVSTHYRKLPTARLYNEYGPTEATVWATVYEPHDDERHRTVLIGKPIPNTRTYVLDERGRRAPVGIPGELYIAGRGVSPGYLDRDAETKSRFATISGLPETVLYRTGDKVRFLSSGDIEFLGRVDDQIKMRGYRIEPGQIEEVLRGHPVVRDVGVTTVQDKKEIGSDIAALHPEVDRIVAILAALDQSTVDQILSEFERE